MLCANGASVDIRGRRGQTALMAACREGQPDCAAKLIASGADVSIADDSGLSSLMHAARGGSESCVDLLLRAGASPSATDKRGRAASSYAFDSSFWQLAARLKELEAVARERAELERAAGAAVIASSARRV